MRRADATRLYYVLQVLLFMPTWVVAAVYLVRDLHFSPLQLVLMGTAMEAAIFVFEVPTGVVADSYSRRLSLIVGFLGMGLAWMLIAAFSQPWVIVGLWGVWGLSSTFTSGAYEAWLTDEVGIERVSGVLLNGARWRYAGSVVGLLGQVAIGLVSRRAAVVAGGAATAFAGLLCIFVMPETGFRRRGGGSTLASLGATAAAGVRYAWAAPVILLLVLVELFMGLSAEAFDRLKEAHFLRDIGLPEHLDPVVWFGAIWLVGMVFGFLGTTVLVRRFAREGSRSVVSALITVTGLELAAMLAFALTRSIGLAAVAMLGVFFARNLADPLYTIWLNRQITDSTVRATVLSISGQANAIGEATAGPVLGVVGNVWGIRAALAAGAAAIAPAIGLYGRAIAHEGREPELAELPARTVVDSPRL